MNIASIDIGTNTILLLVADVNLKTKTITPIHEEIRMPRIGAELHTSGKIPENKITELENILFDYMEIITRYDCCESFVIGTYAMRRASNNIEIQKRIFDHTSLLIDIISPEEEAECAFYGVKASMPLLNTFAIIDIGGGSTEIIIGKGKNILDMVSIPIGVVTLKDSFIQNYPISEEDDQRLKKKINYEMSIINFLHYAPSSLVGISGTPTTLSAIKNNLNTFDAKMIDQTVLSRKEIEEILATLKHSSLNEIKKTYGEIISKREDILYIGGVILLQVMDYLNMINVKVSTYGIRHGVIYKKMIANK